MPNGRAGGRGEAAWRPFARKKEEEEVLKVQHGVCPQGARRILWASPVPPAPPRRSQKVAQDALRVPREHLKTPQKHPKTAQEHPKSTQRPTKTTPRATKDPQSRFLSNVPGFFMVFRGRRHPLS